MQNTILPLNWRLISTSYKANQNTSSYSCKYGNYQHTQNKTKLANF